MPRGITETQLRSAVEYAVASHRLEGIEITVVEQELILRHHRGEITYPEFLVLVLKHAGVKAP